MRRAALAVLVILALLAGGSYLLMNARTVQLFGDIVHRVETDQRIVALTFDDGPTDVVPELIDTLAAHDVRATFFLTGAEMAERPELAAELVAAGHELGNHSWSHSRMLLMSRERIAREVEDTDAQIVAAGHEGPIHFRPPYGKKLVGLPRYLAERGRLTIMVDVEPESDADVAASPERIVERIVDEVEPGSIVLLHLMYEANEPSRMALPGVIEALRADGYELVTVTELLDAAP